MPNLQFITPDWPAPKNVRALSTTRHGGLSTGNYAALNLATHVGDALSAVLQNRERLAQHVPTEPLWLTQVHGTDVVDGLNAGPETQADACVVHMRQRVCAAMTADCLPVLFCDTHGQVVAAAHAGWKGLAAGVLENTVKAMQCPPGTILAWLGPAIGPQAFEVGDEVRGAFMAYDSAAALAFEPAPGGKWRADLYMLARQRLAVLGVTQVYGGGYCTFTERDTFFSARRDGTQTGRQASLIWLV